MTARILEKAGGAVDFIFLGEDLGTQIGPIISLAISASTSARGYQPFCDLAKAYNVPVMMHTCGSSSWAYEDFIAMGIRAVDTLQPEAKDMAPAYLKKRFGGRLAFHGCISTAGPLAFGTVARRRADLPRDAGHHDARRRILFRADACDPGQLSAGKCPGHVRDGEALGAVRRIRWRAQRVTRGRACAQRGADGTRRKGGWGMKGSIPAAAFVVVAALSGAVQAQSFSYADYADALKAYVNDRGMVNYAELKSHSEKLDSFLSSLAGLNRKAYDGWAEPAKIAFWLNAYNACTLQAIIDHYPIQSSFLTSLRYPKNSIRQISGVWDELQFSVMGQPMTLDGIEHGVLRKEFHEPRIHMALVCAAMGCPPLRNEPYTGDRLGAQLDDQARRFLSNPAEVPHRPRTAARSTSLRSSSGSATTSSPSTASTRATATIPPCSARCSTSSAATWAKRMRRACPRGIFDHLPRL